ncbi:MAG: YdeI/OmpD-associated family protein [Candidatus Acidiferrales bacterium]
MSARLVPHRFLATIYKIWMMRHVDVPEDISVALMKELVKSRTSKTPRRSGDGPTKGRAQEPKYIPVVAIVNQRSARVTMVPAGGGRFRIQINTALRKVAKVDAGDLVSVELRLDLASRDLPVPPDFRKGLKAFPKARKAFDALTPAHRRHIIEYFDSTKSLDARQRRLGRVIDFLLERAFLSPRRGATSRRRGRDAT